MIKHIRCKLILYIPPSLRGRRIRTAERSSSVLEVRDSWRRKKCTVLPFLPPDSTIMSHWFTWTHNNPTEDDLELHKSFFGKGGVSLEKGESGTPHLQGFGRTDKKCNLSALKKLCNICHFEQKKGSVQQNIDYISKDPLDGPHYWPDKEALLKDDQGKRSDLTDAICLYKSSGKRAAFTEFPEVFAKYPRLEDVAKYLCEPVAPPDERPLRKWQHDFLEYVAANDNDRVVFWVHDEKGGSGKSMLANYLRMQGYIQLDGKVADMAYMFDATAKGVLFNVARTRADTIDHLYKFCEDVKDGYIISPKYQSRSIRFPSKTVIVFSNFAPDHSKWSKDRYIICTIKTTNAHDYKISFSKGCQEHGPAFQASSTFPSDIAFSYEF